jgi:hypothetical protein
MNLGQLFERKWQAACEAGALAGLPHKGRLDLDDDALIPEEARLGTHLLKSNDALPAWIEDDKALREKISAARSALRRAYYWRQQRLATSDDPAERQRVEQAWLRARAHFEQAVAEINRDIFHFNLRAPSPAVQRLPLRLQEEYERLARPEV